MHCLFWLRAMDAEPLQYPDIFFLVPREKMEVGKRWRRRGGFQSDRMTEKSDNEGLRLSGV